MRGIAGGFSSVGLIALVSVGAQTGSEVDDLLREQMGFSAEDVRAFNDGSAVVNSLDTLVRQELAHVGMVYVDAPVQHFVEEFRDIERFEQGPGTPQIGRFSNPPRYADLASLTLPATDVEALRECRPGDCEVKLSATAMQQFRRDVDWSSPQAADQADSLARGMILNLVRAYQTDGNEALGGYDDGDEPLLVAEQFRALLASDKPFPTPVLGLLNYLDNYPAGRPAGAEDFFYWTVVNFGLKDTVRVNHVTIYPLDGRSPSAVAYVIATKQLYASHYFHATLELRFLLNDDRRDGRPGTALVSITRSRNDGMTGFRGLFLRPLIKRRSRNGVADYLEHMKQQVEHSVAEVF